MMICPPLQLHRRTFFLFLCDFSKLIACIFDDCLEYFVSYILIQPHLCVLFVQTYGYFRNAGNGCQSLLDVHNAVVAHHTFNFQNLLHRQRPPRSMPDHSSPHHRTGSLRRSCNLQSRTPPGSGQQYSCAGRSGR